MFSRDHPLVRPSSSSAPFHPLGSLSLLDSIASDLMSIQTTITSNATYYTVLYGPRPTVHTTRAASY